MGCDCTKFGTPTRVVPIDTGSHNSAPNLPENGILHQKHRSINDARSKSKSVTFGGFIDQFVPTPVSNLISVTTHEPVKHGVDNSMHDPAPSFEVRSHLEVTYDHLSQRINCKPSYNRWLSPPNNSNDNDILADDPVSTSDTIAIDAAIDALPPAANDCIEIVDPAPEAFDAIFLRERQDAIDNTLYRSTIELWKPSTLQELIKTIKKFSKKKSILDRLWFMFYWIALNIEYDVVAFLTNNMLRRSAEDVFATKKCVCTGYSRLYQYLCDKLKIQCVELVGYTKGYGFDKHDIYTSPGVRHVWNAVKIEQYWYLMDITWGTGYINERNEFQRQLNSYYFLVRPNQMIHHHIPDNDQWQLLLTPIKTAQYLRLPTVHSSYFTLKLRIISPLYQAHVSLVSGKSYALILIRTPPDVELIASLKLSENIVAGGHRVVFDDRRQLYRCYFAPASVGKHKISIFAKKNDPNIKLYDEVVSYRLNIDTMPDTPISYPSTWKEFYNLGLKIITPKNIHLIKISNGNTHACVIIRAPDDVELVGHLYNHEEKRIIGGEQVYYDRQQALWICNFAPNQDGLFTANIFGKKKSNPGNCNPIISFKIQATEIALPPLSYPCMWPMFYELNLKVEAPQNCSSISWPETASYVEALVRAPDDVRFLCHIHYDNVEIKNGALAHFDHEKNLWQLLFAPENVGHHELFVFARRHGEVTFECALKFYLDVTQLHQVMKFPTIYDQFLSNRCRIHEPLNGILEKDSIVSIHCVIPGADDVNLIVDTNWAIAEGYANSVLNRQITVGSDNVTIYAAYGQTTTYQSFIKYAVK